jgi:hypothetical protein
LDWLVCWLGMYVCSDVWRWLFGDGANSEGVNIFGSKRNHRLENCFVRIGDLRFIKVILCRLI